MTSMNSLRNKKVSSKYETKEQLTRGGYGHIYTGKDVKSGEEVAIKLILVKPVARGASCPAEAELICHRTLRGLPGVVDYLSGGDCRIGDFDIKYLVMSMATCSLEQLLQSNEKKRKGQAPLTDRVVVLLGLQLLETVRAIHGKGWLHRDLKCENLLVFAHQRPVVQVCDFGLATQFRNRRGVRVTPTPLPEGFARIGYVSPGIARKMVSTEMDDLWMATYSILRMTGYRPFSGMIDKKKMQIKDSLAQDPRSVLKRDQLFLVAFVKKIAAQDGKERVDYQGCLDKLNNCYRKSRSDRAQVSVKSNKGGGWSIH